MARPKSDEKRKAILEAAMEVFAERGFAHAPTSAISKAAGVAEGTLFTYFSSKDELINELYRELRKELDREMNDYPFDSDPRTRIRFIWDQFLTLAKLQPKRLSVIKQLRASGRLFKDAEKPSMTLLELLTATGEAFTGDREMLVSVEFLVLQFRAQIEATVDYIAVHPDQATSASELGFLLFWRGLTGQ
jgi:AcrR family transcriptional regulator